MIEHRRFMAERTESRWRYDKIENLSYTSASFAETRRVSPGIGQDLPEIGENRPETGAR